jgi:hypothetical protein
MPDDNLTNVQRSVLITLMVSAQALPNTRFANSLKAEKRKDLVTRGLIVTTDRPIILDLTQRGHDRAVAELGAEPPQGAGSLGGTLYATLGFLQRLVTHTGIEPADLFRLRIALTPAADSDLPPVDRLPTAAPEELEQQIRAAYARLSSGPGAYLSLAELRHALPAGLTGAEVDAALVALNRAPDVHLVPESSQKSLSEQQRAAAVSIGNQHRHLLAIGS